MNSILCGDCIYYLEQNRPLKKKGGGFKSTNKGHCAKKTIYATNRPGDNIYPKIAETDVLPYGQHKITIVSKMQLEPNCMFAKSQ